MYQLSAQLLLSVAHFELVTAPWPYPYDWSRFPAAWFGANATEWESDAQLAEIGRYAMAILGWQHLADKDNMTAVIYPQITQAALIKRAHPSLPVFVYASYGWAFGMNAAVWPIMNDPAYKEFFLRSGDGYEFSRTNCQQMHTSDEHCIGYFWNFANASARDYFVTAVVMPLALVPTIDGVFFDAFNFAYDIPEYRPWGKWVTNVPNCSTTPAGSATPLWTGCEALLNGTLLVARRTAELLNAHGKLPMFANPGSFAKPPAQKIWLDEGRLVKALDGLHWSTYYESFRGDVAPADPSANLPNMLREAALGVPAVVHTYYHEVEEPPEAHVAAFLLARSEQWYFLGSTGWWDNSYRWTPLYDACKVCGRPRGPAKNQSVAMYTRAFEGCSVTLDCTNASACVGSITFPPVGGIVSSH